MYETFWTPGNVHNVEYGSAVLILTVVELRFNILKWFRNYVGNFFGRPIKTIQMFSSVFVIWMWLSLILFVKFDSNLLTLRAFNFQGNGFGTGHWTTWVSLAAIFTVWGWNNAPAGFLVVGFFSALHEAFWYLFYFIVYPDQFNTTFGFYLPFVYLGAALSIGYFFLSRNGSIPKIPKQTLLIVLVMFVVFDAMWALSCFPVTISLTIGGTQFFTNLPVNLIEGQSWVLPGIPLIISKKEEAKPKATTH